MITLVSKYYPQELLREMADSRAGAEKGQDEPGNLVLSESKEMLKE